MSRTAAAVHKSLRPLSMTLRHKPLTAPTLQTYIFPPSHYTFLSPHSSTNPSSPRTMTVLTLDTINRNVRAAQYAVRGLIPQRAETYRAQLAKGEGKDLPFDKVIFANIGNPQQLDQKPITFFRQVASLLEYPPLLDQAEDVLTGQLGYKKDAIARARRLLKEVNSVGAYSNSSGAPGIRQSVADFIERKYLFLLFFFSLDFGYRVCDSKNLCDFGTPWEEVFTMDNVSSTQKLLAKFLSSTSRSKLFSHLEVPLASFSYTFPLNSSQNHFQPCPPPCPNSITLSLTTH
jgi:hypothetical protein